jgi:hypothetical protein
MTDRPIIFSAPMVRALLEGRKTQTRRLAWVTAKAWGGVTTNPCQPKEPPGEGRRWVYSSWTDVKPGDRLYVREASCVIDYRCRYRADEERFEPKDFGLRWRPSIHMPRWASRLTLTVTDVRVQRLREISEADAVAEGCECDSDGWRDYQFPATQCCGTAIDSYRTLWNSLHGPEAWDANPWVAAISFTVERRNIDA